MLQPTGPLPSEIYWRRRMLAIAVLAVVGVIVLAVVLTTRGGGSPENAPVAASNTSTTTAATTTSSTKSTSTSRTSTSATTSPNASATTTPTIAAVVPPGQCPDQSLALTVSVDQPTWAVGSSPKFGVRIINTSGSVCDRDTLGQQQVLVYSADGQQRLWASTDCYKDPADVRKFHPGQQAGYVITWSGTTSQPNCAGNRETVKAGAYIVVAQLGGLRSAPEPFNIA